MAISLYAVSVPVFKQMLSGMNTALIKAEEHATAKNIDPNVLLQSRLFPDMFPFVRQVQIATNYARGISARLAGVDVPESKDGEQTFSDLRELISNTLAFIEGFKPAQIDGNEGRSIILRPGTPKERKLTGQSYLLTYGLPQFFFHVTTAYGILRHNGIDVGKGDYMGR